MFREMRRKRQSLSEEESVAILEKMTSGVLALSGDGGYPYAVPLSYVYRAGNLYFHSAPQGHKIDAIRRCGKASFCVIGQDRIVPERYTTYFRSVVAFGQVRIIEDKKEKWRATAWLAAKYVPGLQGFEEELKKGFDRMCIIELKVEHLSGKEAVELVRDGRQEP